MIKILSFILLLALSTTCIGQKKMEVPASYSNIKVTESGVLYLELNGEKIGEALYLNPLELSKLEGDIKGFAKGLFFDFQDSLMSGKLIYGFIPYGDSKHPHPVYYNSSSRILQGKTSISISSSLSGRYDMIGWQQSGLGTIGYRVVAGNGQILYDGKVHSKGKALLK